MKINYLCILFVLFSVVSCTNKQEKSNKLSDGISVTEKILSKLNLIDLEEGLIQKEKIKEIYDLLFISVSNQKTIDNIAIRSIYKLFNNDSLAKNFLEKESVYIKNNFVLDSIKVNSDTILVSLKKENKLIKRSFIYKLVNDSIIDKKLPPTVYFKITELTYFDNLLDSLKAL